MASRYSKRHYEDMAAMIRDLRPDMGFDLYTRGERAAYDAIANRLIELFKADNPRFDADRFEEACNE